MSKTLKIIKTITLTKEGQDIKNVGIPKGTKLHITWIADKAPFGDGHRLMQARVDNGTGHLQYMPEIVVRDTEIEFQE